MINVLAPPPPEALLDPPPELEDLLELLQAVSDSAATVRATPAHRMER
jgi:hypothetical protein